MSSENQRDAELERVKTAARNLIDHFDFVQIFVGRYEPPEGTVYFKFGLGDFFSRYGLCRHWLLQQEHQSRLDIEN